MAQRQGRDPQRPYVDNHGSLASLAKHIRMGLDLSKEATVVKTHELALLLDHIIAIGFRGHTAQKFQSDLSVAYDAAATAQTERAMHGDDEDA